MVVGNFIQELDTIVIGGGPGGYTAAIRLAQLGKKVTLFEKNKLGGTCLHRGCIPSKALISVAHQFSQSKKTYNRGITYKDVEIDFEETQNWKQKEVIDVLCNGVNALLKKNKINVIYGEVNFVDKNTISVIVDEFHNETYHFKKAIIATGGKPLEIKGFKFNEKVLNSTTLLSLNKIPKSLVVIGGGYIGIELAGVFSDLGSKVTILEGDNKILKGFDDDLTNIVEKKLKESGVEIITKALAKSNEIKNNEIILTYEKEDKINKITSEYILVAIGRKPDFDELGLDFAGIQLNDKGLIKVDKQCKTNQENIFAIGDIVEGLPLAHKASYEAKIAAEALCGDNSSIVDYLSIPTVCFTNPEIATVGYTANLAKENGFDIVVGQYNFSHNGRALTMSETDGFVKLVAEKNTNKLLGAQIVGPLASELIAELSLAVEQRLTIEDISFTIHGHPSLNEVILEAADMILKKAIHG